MFSEVDFLFVASFDVFFLALSPRFKCVLLKRKFARSSQLHEQFEQLQASLKNAGLNRNVSCWGPEGGSVSWIAARDGWVGGAVAS